MIQFTHRALKGRVARRVFLLFVLSAFIPLAAVAALSLTQLRQFYLKQGDQRLAAAGKGYGMSLYERLQLAEESAATAAALINDPRRREKVAAQHFRALSLIDPVAGMRALFGKIHSSPALTARARERLADGKSVLITQSDNAGSRILLLVPPSDRVSDVESGRFVLGELKPEYLWGTPDLLPAATDVCVLDEASRLVLFCSAPMPRETLQTIDNPSSQSAFGSASWVQQGENHRAVAWGQFMRAEFGTADWIVVASQPESYQLSRVAEFRQIFIPAVILALLVVLLLSMRQIRSTLVPLEKLAAGARRVAQNDFLTQVDVTRTDEFGELATAFNQMSAKLGRQFAALKALAEIDQQILSTLDTDRIIGTVLERIGDMVPADFAGITLLDHDNPELARTYSRALHANAHIPVARQRMEANEREELATSPRGFWTPVEGAGQEYLAPLRDWGMRTAYVQPIIWRNTVCGALVLGFRATVAASDDDRKQTHDFADRVAVAISSAWRDEQLYLQAHYDGLTGLPNRLLLRDRLAQEIVRCERTEGSFAVLFIDLDHFKNVNDTQGHTSGDEVLKVAASRIARCVREADTVSRHGGDEFTVVLTQIHRPQDVGRLSDNIVQALSEPFLIDDQTCFLSASIGIALYPQDGDSAETLIKHADTAMYRAKSQGRAQAVFFEERMNAEAVARFTLDRELRHATDRGEIELHFQPQVDLRTGTVHRAEALMRWVHPTLGPISTERFVQIAEESGQIEHLGSWVVREACRQMKAWQLEGVPLHRLAFNVSARQFRKESVVGMIWECAHDAGIAMNCLELEVTESVLIDHDPAVARTLKELAAMGVTISLDDFGTGFSSLAYLKQFPFHNVKIDRVFIEDLGRNDDSETMVAAIIAMSHALGKEVIAEGVETGEQFSLLKKLQCDHVQGFRLSPPLAAAEFAAFLKTRPS